MSITTKTGDRGTTRLFSGEQVDKCSPRPETYGDLDELISVLGVARLHCQSKGNREALLELQRELFVVGSELATSRVRLDRLKKRIDAERLRAFEARRDALEASIEVPKVFVVPAASLAAAHLDVARTVARRLERKVVGLARAGEIDNEHLLVYVNRISDYLWLMARSEEDESIPL